MENTRNKTNLKGITVPLYTGLKYNKLSNEQNNNTLG